MAKVVIIPPVCMYVYVTRVGLHTHDFHFETDTHVVFIRPAAPDIDKKTTHELVQIGPALLGLICVTPDLTVMFLLIPKMRSVHINIFLPILQIL